MLFNELEAFETNVEVVLLNEYYDALFSYDILYDIFDILY